MAPPPATPLLIDPQRADWRARWEERGWRKEARAWAAGHVPVSGRIEPMRKHRKPWSVVARVPMVDGFAWLKEVSAGLAYEPALTEALARRAPDHLPEVLAIDGLRMLTLHAGPRLTPQEQPLSTWAEVVAQFAELQIELVQHAADLPAPTSSPEALARRFGARVDPLVDALGDTIPLSVVKLNLSCGNILNRNGSPVFIDWASAAIGHPFCSLLKPLRLAMTKHGAQPGGTEVLRLRDAYLEPWTAFAPLRALRRIFSAAHALAHLCRALEWDHKLAGLPVALRVRYEPEVRLNLSNFAAAARAPRLLGIGSKDTSLYVVYRERGCP